MPLLINSTVASLQAQTRLARSQDGLATALQRLSSGLRVNGARDDAAGLAVAERMRADLGGTQAALRNVNDGISLFQTGEHAMGQMQQQLQRMRELALQSLNDSNTAGDRRALDGELQQLLAELERTAGSTRFNGRKLLDGSAGQMEFQIGAGSQDTVSLDLSTDLRSTQLGPVATARSVDLRTSGFEFLGTYTTGPLGNLDFSQPDVPLTPGRAVATTASTNYSGGQSASFSVDGIGVSLNTHYGSLDSVANSIQAQLNASQNGAYVVSEDGSHVTITKTARARNAAVAPAMAALAGANSAPFGSAARSNGVPASSNTHAGFSVDGHRVFITADHSGNVDGLIADIQGQLNAAVGPSNPYRVVGSTAGISIRRSSGHVTPVVGNFTDDGRASFSRGATSYLTLGAGDLTVQIGSRPAVDITGRFATAEALARAVQSRAAGSVVSIDQDSGRMEINASETVTIGGAQAGPSGSLAFEQLVNPATGSLAEADVLDTRAAATALLRIDAAIGTLGAQRGSLGAALGRFDAVIGALQDRAEVLSASRGRVIDADYAGEAAALTGAQVLRSAGLAMLAQVKVRPQDVLALLRPGTGGRR